MKEHISWVGFNCDGRIWGYLEKYLDISSPVTTYFGWNRQVYTFWGAKGSGKVFFKAGRMNAAYEKRLVQKRKKYTKFDNKEFEEKVHYEFSQFLLVTTLKGK